jgi:hypothetical protein
MKDKHGADLASQMRAARELLEEGEVRDALVLAMDVLWRELDQLRDTLAAVQEDLHQVEVATEAEPLLTEFTWPKPLSHIVH